jgi:hypothetical protein
MASLTRWFDRLVVLFFIAHIPTTLFFDAQAGTACCWTPCQIMAHWHAARSGGALAV